MAWKKDVNYFDAFVGMAEYTCRAAKLLNEIMKDFKVEELQEKMKEMHAIEQGGDEARHTIIKKLAHEFITNIEREDIMAMTDAIDNVTDSIEDVLLRMYMCNVSHIYECARKMAEIIERCCESLLRALREFHNFHKSKILHDYIVEINRLEEVGDRLYTEAVRELYVKSGDCKQILAWDQIYFFLEKCCDDCEEAANLIESVIMKNT